MAREFLTRSADDDDDHIAANIQSREQELACYYANIQSYTEQIAALSSLPDSLPPEMQVYVGKSAEQLRPLGATDEQAELARQWNWRERLKVLLVTESAECSKSELAYDALLAQLPQGTRRDAALARLAAKKGA